MGLGLGLGLERRRMRRALGVCSAAAKARLASVADAARSSSAPPGCASTKSVRGRRKLGPNILQGSWSLTSSRVAGAQAGA